MDFQALLGNQIMTGMSAAAILSWALYQLKAIPQQIYYLIKRYTTVKLTIFNDNQKWWLVNKYIVDCQKERKYRTIAIDNYLNLIPGIGQHFFWLKNKPVFLTRGRLDSKQGGPTEQLDIIVFGRTPIVLEDFIQQIKDSLKEIPKQEIYIRTTYWARLKNKTLKNWDSVILTGNLKEDILKDYNVFVNRESEYHRKGLPYKRCYMFSGPPGTGKTSTILALASKLKKELFILNLKDIDSDNALIDAVNDISKNSIILIEDIDRNQMVLKPEFQKEIPNDPGGGLRQGVVSLSGLLNLLDGVTCPEGQVFIITTNHIEKLTPALVRPGRIDRLIDFKLFGPKEQIKYLKKFYDTEDDISEDKLPVTIIPSELQAIVLANELENTLLILQGRKENVRD